MGSTFLQCEQVVTVVSDAFNISENELTSLRDSVGEQVLHIFKINPETTIEQLLSLLKKENNKNDLLDSAIVQDIIEISNALTEETEGYSWNDIDFIRYVPGGRMLSYALHDILYDAGMSRLYEIDIPNGEILWNGEKESVGDFLHIILVNMLMTIQAGFYFPANVYTAELEAWEKVFSAYMDSPLSKITNTITKEA